MQLLADKGYEGGETCGLGLIPGEVRKLEAYPQGTKIPHVGWNAVDMEKPSRFFDGIPSGRDFYFVHSYAFVCADDRDIFARTPYCGTFVSAIEKGNILGVQFHPEKSMRWGLALLKNFLSM
jgi:glutamine amidotransferase